MVKAISGGERRLAMANATAVPLTTISAVPRSAARRMAPATISG
jgi:hypothetical protein